MKQYSFVCMSGYARPGQSHDLVIFYSICPSWSFTPFTLIKSTSSLSISLSLNSLTQSLSVFLWLSLCLSLPLSLCAYFLPLTHSFSLWICNNNVFLTCYENINKTFYACVNLWNQNYTEILYSKFHSVIQIRIIRYTQYKYNYKHNTNALNTICILRYCFLH